MFLRSAGQRHIYSAGRKRNARPPTPEFMSIFGVSPSVYIGVDEKLCPMSNNIAETIYSTNDWMNKRLAPIDFHRSIGMRAVSFAFNPRKGSKLETTPPVATSPASFIGFRLKTMPLRSRHLVHDGCTRTLAKIVVRSRDQTRHFNRPIAVIFVQCKFITPRRGIPGYTAVGDINRTEMIFCRKIPATGETKTLLHTDAAGSATHIFRIHEPVAEVSVSSNEHTFDRLASIFTAM